MFYSFGVRRTLLIVCWLETMTTAATQISYLAEQSIVE